MISVLRVDDDSTYLVLSKRCLEMLGGLTVKTALLAQEALKELRTNTSDVVFAEISAKRVQMQNTFFWACLLFLILLLVPTVVAIGVAPTVTSITPSTGVSTASVTITNLAGTNFASGATVMMTPVTAAPVHKGSILNGAGGSHLYFPTSVFVSGNYAYVVSTGSSSLEIVDVSNPASPIHKGGIVHGGSTLLSGPQSVYVSGNYAYVASYGSNALEIVDVSSPAAPVHKGSIADGAGGALLNEPQSVYVSGNYAYVASYGSNALEIVDVSSPAAPVHKGSIADGAGGALLGQPLSVSVSGNYAYVGSGNSNALEIVDVSSPAAPVHKGSIADGAGGALMRYPQSVYVAGNYAYVASANSNALEIVDVSNPAAPVHKGNILNGAGGALLNNPYAVSVSGNYAYVAGRLGNTLEIIDVSNPAAPVHKGSIADGAGGALLNNPYAVSVSGNYAYVASYGSSALEIVDIGTVPATNVVVSSSTITCTFDLTNKIAGLYNVVVTNPDGQFGTLNSGFTVTNPAPTFTSITPSSGPAVGGTSVTIVGTNFISGGLFGVTIGGTAATSVVLVDSAHITVTTPAGTAGAQNVVVTNNDGQIATGTGAFTYVTPAPPPPPPPVLTTTPTSTPAYIAIPAGGGGGGYSAPPAPPPVQQVLVPPPPAPPPSPPPAPAPAVSQSSHMGFQGLTFNENGQHALSLSLGNARAAGVAVTMYFDHVVVYQHMSPGVTMTFWGDNFKNTNGTITGTVKSADFVTDPIIANLTTLGNMIVSGSIHAGLPYLTQQVTIDTTLNGNVSADVTDQFQNVAVQNNLQLENVAYTMNVQRVNLTATGPANVTLTIPPSWVDQYGGKDAVRIGRISDQTGMVELLKTVYNGTDTNGNLVFRGESPNGASIFGLLTAKATAVKLQEQPNATIQPLQKPAIVTEVGMFGWISTLLIQNPFALVILIGLLIVSMYFGWRKRRL